MFARPRASAINRSGRFTSRRAATAATRFRGAAPNSPGRARPEWREEVDEDEREDLPPAVSPQVRAPAPAVKSRPVFGCVTLERTIIKFSLGSGFDLGFGLAFFFPGQVARFVSEPARRREKAGETDRDAGQGLGAAGASTAVGQDVVLQGFVEEQFEAQE